MLPAQPRNHSLARFLIAAIALGLAGCPRPTLTSVNAPSPSPMPPPSEGKLGRGDTFEVHVYLEPELSGKYRVGADGNIDFPFCGRLNVIDENTSDLASRLRECLSRYIKHPEVAVVLLEQGSHKKIFVFGQVQKPGTFPYEDQMSIVEAITLAGGFNQYAGQNNVTVTRMTSTGDQKYTVRVQDIGTGKAANFYLLPEDIVFVPESPL